MYLFIVMIDLETINVFIYLNINKKKQHIMRKSEDTKVYPKV